MVQQIQTVADRLGTTFYGIWHWTKGGIIPEILRDIRLQKVGLENSTSGDDFGDAAKEV